MSSTPKSVIQTVVIVLGLVTLALIAGAFLLIALDHTVPDPVWTLAGVGVGAFGSLLASTRTNDGPAPVNVVNAPNDPVPVDAQPEPPSPAASVLAASSEHQSTLPAPLAPEEHAA